MAFVLILLLSNCGTPKQVEVQTKYIKTNIPKQTHPAPLQLSNVHWYVVTKDNLDEFIKRFKKEHGKVVFIATTVQGYQNIAVNTAELKRYIDQQKQIIAFYEKYTK